MGKPKRVGQFEKKIVFCSDDARVVRAGELLDRYRRETVREIADDLGVSATLIWQHLNHLGVEPRQQWPKEPTKEKVG